ncbi:MAG: N-acetyl-gamma-glutamyl-phosphate reductase, partial [Candidatus Glassbacteria bacterium]|nr:N-acetyl-gamma-glutamyl-phosphate reductase [Candidatus Glassbacteria bacterium]
TSGYTGLELVRILLGHPEVEIAFATSETYAGKTLGDVFPCGIELKLIPAADADPSDVDAVFTCLPHTTAMETVGQVYRRGLKVIDLSADFRFRDPADYRQWYDTDHLVPELLCESAYGLPELFRGEIVKAGIVGNPGCYPTTVLLAVGPLAAEGWLAEAATVIVDSKSGVTGAGRKASLATHYVEVNEEILPYNLGRTHRHVGEMETVLGSLAGREVKVAFTPQLAPFNRGILSTIYLSGTGRSAAEVAELLDGYYAEEPFVSVLGGGRAAQLGYVRYNNRCVLGVHEVAGTELVLITAAIDNLVKGAAGAAVQNFNLVFGIGETAGLDAGSGRI